MRYRCLLSYAILTFGCAQHEITVAKEMTVPDVKTSSSSDSDGGDEPLDQGHGWVVVFICWFMHVTYLGTQYSFATLFPFLLDAFKAKL